THRELAETQRAVEVLHPRQTLVGEVALHALAVEHLLGADLELLELLLHQPAADLLRLLLLLRVEPVADLALGARGADEAQPVAAGLARRVGEDLDDVAVLER